MTPLLHSRPVAASSTPVVPSAERGRHCPTGRLVILLLLLLLLAAAAAAAELETCSGHVVVVCSVAGRGCIAY